ncbi:MAG: hypothetical protein IJV00_02965 [Clostridia bacterium]|nr:hypothetical protein [Clostridia bacterium]
MKRTLPFLVLFALFFSYAMLNPQKTAASVSDAYAAVRDSLLPSLFVPMALTSFAFASPLREAAESVMFRIAGKAFSLKKSQCSALLFGLLCGFPMGIALSSRLRSEGRITKAEYERMCLFSNNCGAGFIFSFLSSRSSFGTALSVFSAQLLSSLILARLSLPLDKSAPAVEEEAAPRKIPGLARSAVEAIRGASATFAVAGGFVIFFGFVRSALSDLTGAQNGVKTLIDLFTELSAGTAAALPSVPLSAAAVGWGGICVHAQSAAAAGEEGLPALYLPFRVLNALLCAFFSSLFSKLFL